MNLTWFRLFLLLMLHITCDGINSPPERVQQTEMVKLKNGNNGWSKTKISSTLRWIPSKVGKSLHHHAVRVNNDNNDYVWCRATFIGQKVPGGVVENGTCAFAFYAPAVVYAKTYEVLISDEGSARVKKVPWDSFMTKPTNCLLSSDRVLIVVSDADNPFNYVAGNVGFKDTARKALYPSSDRIRKAERGLILVEDEPNAYNLKNVKFKVKAQRIYSSPKTLYSTQLSNDDRTPKLINHTFSYTLPTVQYWGKLKGCITGLTSTVYVNDDEPMDVFWGMESTLKRTEFSSINYDLPPLSGINVTVVGTLEEFRAPYEGILTTIYDDGYTKNRRVSSRHISKVFKRVVVLFSSPFFLNGSIVDVPERSELLYEHTTTTTTTTPSTTTSQSTTTLPTTTDTTDTTPLLITKIFNSPSPISETPKDSNQSQNFVIQTLSIISSSETTVPSDRKRLRNSESIFDENDISNVESEKQKGTSDRILSALSTIFTGLVFWYFSLGLTV